MAAAMVAPLPCWKPALADCRPVPPMLWFISTHCMPTTSNPAALTRAETLGGAAQNLTVATAVAPSESAPVTDLCSPSSPSSSGDPCQPPPPLPSPSGRRRLQAASPPVGTPPPPVTSPSNGSMVGCQALPPGFA